jgi:hypothetical protein
MRCGRCTIVLKQFQKLTHTLTSPIFFYVNYVLFHRLALDNMGAKLEVAKYTEKLVPSTRFVAVDGVAPTLSETATFVAPSASVIGNVTIGSRSRYVMLRYIASRCGAVLLSIIHASLVTSDNDSTCLRVAPNNTTVSGTAQLSAAMSTR